MAKGPVLSPEEFTIRKPVFQTGVLVFVLGTLGGLYSDWSQGNAVATLLDLATLAVVLLITLAVWRGALDRGRAVAGLLYAGAFNFLFSIGHHLINRSATLDTAIYNNLFILALFLAVSALLVGRTAILALGGTILVVLLTASVFWNNALTAGNLWFEIPAVTGATYLLFHYRGSLDRLLADLKRVIGENTSLRQRERLASLGEISAGIAHEIKNPLNFVVNFAESSRELLTELETHLDTSSPSEQQREERDYLLRELHQNLEDIRTQGLRGVSTVQGMLHHARTGNGEFQAIDLNEVAGECLFLAGLGSKRGRTVQKFQAWPEPVMVRGSRSDLSRAFLNLCNNAFWSVVEKARREDALYTPQVTVTVEMAKSEALVLVRDNGVGFSAQTKAQLFVPFFTTKPAGEGTGLGLALTREVVVDQHGGRLEASGDLETGALFSVFLPLLGDT